MKYIVVAPTGELSKVYIMADGAMVTQPFESWALRDGKQIVFATIKMHKVLQSHHFAGSYENGAMYAYTYDEMCAIISSHIGPSDRERYETGLKEESNKTLIKGSPVGIHLPKWQRIAYILWKALEFAVRISIKAFSVVIFLVILPFILKWFGGFRK